MHIKNGMSMIRGRMSLGPLLLASLLLASCGGGGGGGGGSSGSAPPVMTPPSDLQYPAAPTFVVDTAIAAVTPTVVGEVTSYSVSPALPAGLTLNTTTGVISGTPTGVAAKADYTVKAANAAGSTTATVSIVVMTAAPAFTAKSGVAQKGPLIQGSTVTVQELDSSLSPTGQQFSYQILTNFGTFSPTSTFTSQYLGLIAAGYYFDEVADTVSTGPITLNAYSDLTADSVLNVNLLTTLEYQRIQNLVTQSNMTFAAARTQAETEVLAALNIPAGSYGSFDSLNLTGSSDGDYILAAISSLFVYGNSAGPLSALIASFQSDIGTHGVITNPATTAALVAAAKGINPTTVAANLTQYYASQGLTFTPTNISDWIAQSGDGVIGRDAFSVPDATPSTAFTFPSYVVSQFAGLPVSVTVGQLTVNGTAVNGTVSFNKDDIVAVSPSVGSFPNGVLTSYLVTGKRNLARVSFVSGLVSIAVTPSMPSVPLGVTQQFTATGTFSDTSTADLTSSVTWTSGTPAVATVNASSGLANVLTVGSTVITATSGSVSGSTTLTATPATLQSIAITPNPITIGTGSSLQLTATGTYSDGTTQSVTTSAHWTSDTPSVATIGPSTGLATAVSAGSATISATIGSITATAPLSVVTLVSIAITPNPATIALGSSQQLTATGTFADGSTQNVTTAANWTSDTSSVATVGPSTGLATAVSVGSATISAAIGSLTATTPLSVVPGVWTSTGSMVTARDYHTATLLTNGAVLAAGGLGTWIGSARNYLSGSELYNPVAGVWTTSASMATARVYHTATLLTNGKVLVAGGSASDSSNVASAEIYDPVAGTWTVTGSMTTSRIHHTATLLPNGTVLVAGGVSEGPCNPMGSPANYNPMASAEIYDPTTGTWTAVGCMTNGRTQHTATLLPNGMVLVAGGQIDNSDETASAELYDPSAGTWTVTGSMITARASATATLLPNGTVLVAGGFNTQIGTPSGILGTAELYDPVAGSWTATGTMASARELHTATLLPSGTVLVAGGDFPCTPTPDTEIYDPAAGTWTVSSNMLTLRYGHAATLLPNGTALVAGGFNVFGDNFLSSAEIYQDLEGSSHPPLPGTKSVPGQCQVLSGSTASVEWIRD